jgi:hypothetical protein
MPCMTTLLLIHALHPPPLAGPACGQLCCECEAGERTLSWRLRVVEAAHTHEHVSGDTNGQ